MPLSSVYNIETRYRVDSKKARRAVDSLGERMEKLSKSAERTKNRLTGLFTGLMAGAGAAGIAGVGLATRHMVKLGMATESAKISIAGIFSTVGDKSKTFTQNLERAQTLFDKFGEASIQSPFDRYDFADVFGAAAPVLASTQLGLTDDQITQLTGRATMAAKIFNQGDMEQTGRDLVQMIQGTAGMDTKTYAALQVELFDQLGVSSTEAFNQIAKSNPTKVFEAINKALKGLDPALKSYGSSFEGLFSTITEQINIGFMHAWDAFKGEVKDDLSDVADYLKAHRDEIKAYASSAGKLLGNTFEKIGQMAAFAATHIKGLTAAVIALGAVKGIGVGLNVAELAGLRLVGGRGGLGGLWDKAKSGLAGSSSLQKAASGGGGYRQAMYLAPIIAKQDPSKGTLGGLIPKVGGLASLSSMFSSLASAAGPLVGILAPLTAIIAGIAGTFKILTSDAQSLGLNARLVKEYFGDAVDRLLVSLDSLAKKFGSDGIGDLIGNFVEFMGTGFVGILGLAIDTITLFVIGIDNLVSLLMASVNTMADMYLQWQNAGGGIMDIFDVDVGLAHKRGLKSAFKDSAVVAAYGDDDISKKADNILGGLKDRSESTKKPENQGTPKVNVTNHITQHIRTEASPDRIALRAADVIGQKVRHSIKPFAPGL